MPSTTRMTTQEAFEEFERKHVRVPDQENAAAKQLQYELRAALKRELGERHGRSFLAGSYARKTQAVHLKDLDIIIVLNDPDGQLLASASGTLALMKSVAIRFEPVIQARTKCRAVECELAGVGFHADFVPALEEGRGGLLLAYVDRDEQIDEWRPADPEGQTKAGQEKNVETGGAYVPVSRIGKFWNQSFTSSPDQEKPLPSYYVEAILHDALWAPTGWPEAVLSFFENAHRHLSLPWPSIPCPGASDDHVDEQLENDRRLRALALVEEALVHARAARDANDDDAARDAWAKVFGQAFPAPSTDPQAVGRALGARKATVVGAGVSPKPTGHRPIPARSHGRARRQS